MTTQFCGRTRRETLAQLGGGFGSLALAGLLPAADAPPAAGPMAPKPAMHPAKAKAVIFLFMYGGPSQVDTFDHKPNLYPLDGKTIPIKTFGRGGHKADGRVVGPKWAFKPYGQCGKMVSDLFPHTGKHVDDMAFVHSLYAESPIHGSAVLMMNSGRLLSGNPCLGSWVTYGLGSENQNLPGFVVMLDGTGGPISGPKNWSSGYMPASYQGVVVRADKTPIHDLQPPAGMTREQQRTLLDRLKEKNEAHALTRADNSELAARIASYELAYKMQAHAPEAVDFARESKETLELYGIEGPTKSRTADFGRKCLLARRLVERGVPFVEVTLDGWDTHANNFDAVKTLCGTLDPAWATLMSDLKERGLLDSTLVVCMGEFGRTPKVNPQKGRDHFPTAWSAVLAGGGIKGGQAYGRTRADGLAVEDKPVSVPDLLATVCTAIGVDPAKTNPSNVARPIRVVDTAGTPLRAVLA